MRKAHLVASGLLLATLAQASAGARAETVGNVGAANQSARGTPPGQSGHTLTLGGSVANRERIETSADGSAQIVFLDTSTMTVGRNSAVTVDHFVYNGNAGAGAQGLSLAKGVMRFVGGGVSHSSGAQVKTPSASIGVRGGAALVSLGGECGALVILQNGVVTVSNASDTTTLTRAGYGVCAPADGGAIPEATLISASTIAALNARLVSKGRQTAGAVTQPDDPDARRKLGHERAPDETPFTGLDLLAPVWGGDAIVRSHAGVINQPTTPPPDIGRQNFFRVN
jgi:hypothetical protein